MSYISFLVLFLGVVVLATPSTSRLLYNKPQFNREAIEQLYVQAQAVVDTLDEETTKHHLSPLPSKRWEGKAIEIQEEVKNYVDEALSPSETLGIDDEVNNDSDIVLPPSEIILDEMSENYRDFALSPRQNIDGIGPFDNIDPQELLSVKELAENFYNFALSPEGVVEIEKEVENQHDNSLKPSKTWAIDEEAENYHHFALSPADRLEEKAIEMEVEVQNTYTTP